MIKEFKTVLLRGNTVDLAGAVVVGAAFGALVAALVGDLVTPRIAALFGTPDLSGLIFTINQSVFRYGHFINAVAFILVTAAVFFFVVVPESGRSGWRRSTIWFVSSRTTPSSMRRVHPRQVVTTGRKWEAIVGYARAVRVGSTIEICGCAPTAADGSTVGGGDVYEQTRQCLRVIGEALAGVGAGFDDVTRTRIFTTVPRRWREIGKAHGEVFGAIKPVTSLVGVRGLLDPKWLVEIEASAYRADD